MAVVRNIVRSDLHRRWYLEELFFGGIPYSTRSPTNGEEGNCCGFMFSKLEAQINNPMKP